MSSIRIATRNSPLALWQANFVKDQLEKAHRDLTVTIVGMTTAGDQLLDRSLATAGGKGLFLKELEVSLLNNQTDIAVHSMKDVPVTLPQGLEVSVVCQRADPRDVFVSNEYQNLYALPKGSRVGTSSLRRVSQLKNAFPELEFAELRGNVNSRLAKLDDGDYDAIILAAAGLTRLGMEGRIKQFIKPELCLPAVGQGIIGIESRFDDEETRTLLEPLHSRESALCLAAERSMNAQLEGGCQVPVAGYAELKKGRIHLRGRVGRIDGTQVLKSESLSQNITADSADKLGALVAQELLGQGAGEILKSIYDEPPSSPTGNKPVVLLTRQRRYLGNMVKILERLDYQPMHVSTLHIEANTDADALQPLQNLQDYTDILFVSRNSVEVGMPIIQRNGGFPDGLRAITVGAETAKQLYQYGVDAMFPEHGSGAEALLKVAQMADLAGRKILIVRGKVGINWPGEIMQERGAKVERVVVYDQVLPSKSEERLHKLLSAHHDIDGVFAHSGQSLRNLVSIAGKNSDRLINSTVVAGSQGIADVAAELNWQGEIRIAQSPSNKHMMIAFSQ